MVEQELEQKIGLFLLEADDMSSESFVDEQGFLAGDGMDTNDGVLGFDRLAPHDATLLPRVFRLVNPRMDSAQTLEAFLELGGKAVVCFNLRPEQSVSADGGLIEDEEEGRSGGLLLVGNVRVPSDLSDAVAAVVVLEEGEGLGVEVDDVEFGEALDVARGWVALNGPKVPKGFAGGEYGASTGENVAHLAIST